MYGKSGERAYAVKQTFSGGYVVAGSTGSPTDILFMKTDAGGNLLWAKTYGGAADENVNCIAQTRDSGYILVGSTSSFGLGDNDVYLIKTDINGNVQWSKTYGGTGSDAGTYVCQLGDGGYMIAGGTDSYGQGNSDCYLIKTDANGQLLWAKTYGGPEGEEAYTARLTKDGGVIMVGETESYIGTGSFDAYMLKADSSGNLQWAKAVDFGGAGGGEEGFDVTETFDGGFVFSMEPEHILFSGSGGDFALLKLDRLGNFVWNSPVRGWQGWDFGYSLQQTSDSGFIVAGVRGLFTGERTRAAIYKSDKNGNVLWFKSFGDTIIKRDAQAIDITADGGFIAAGYIKDPSLGYTGDKFYLIKINTTGNSNYCNEINDIPSGAQPTLIFTPGGVEGSGGMTTSAATITTVINLRDTVLSCSLVTASCPTANFSFTPACSGDSTSFADLSTDSSGNNHLIKWQWNYGDGGTDMFYTSTNPKHKYATPGPFNAKLTVYNDFSCADSTTKTIAVPAGARAGTVAMLADTICENTAANFSVAGSTGDIQWQSSVIGISFVDIAGAQDSTLVDLPVQSTYYRVVAINGICSDTSLSVKIVVMPQPPAPNLFAADTLICSGDSTHICASGPYTSYLWNTSAADSCIDVKSAGGYWVTVTGANGCSVVSAHQTLSIYPPTPVTIAAHNDTLTSVNAFSYQWLLNDTVIEGATLFYYVAHRSGDYSVEVTDTNGCKAVSNSIHMTVTGITTLFDDEQISVFPNPAGNTLHIVNTLPGGDILHYRVANALGLIVGGNKNTGSTLDLDISSFSSGLYFIYVATRRGYLVKKFIKE